LQLEQLDTLLTVDDVAELLSVCVRTVWQKVSNGSLPKPVCLSPQIRRWRASEIQAYIDKLPR